MRLFVAVNLTEPCKKALLAVQRDLLARADAGRAMPAAQLHLTLAFIGESDRPAKATACLAGLAAGPATIEIAGVGRFGRGGEILVWAGLRPCMILEALAADVRRRLLTGGFAVDPKPFRPHLTLARRVVLHSEADWAAFERAWPADRTLCTMEAERVSLMESALENGKLVYSEVTGISL